MNTINTTNYNSFIEKLKTVEDQFRDNFPTPPSKEQLEHLNPEEKAKALNEVPSKKKEFNSNLTELIKLFNCDRHTISKDTNQRQMANLKHRLRAVAVDLKGTTWSRLIERLFGFITFGIKNIGRTQEEIVTKMTDDIYDPYATKYVVGNSNNTIEDKINTNLRMIELDFENEKERKITNEILENFKKEIPENSSPLKGKIIENSRTKVTTDLTPTEYSYEGETGKAASCTTIGPKPTQEDRSIITEITINGKKCSFDGVYDGHNGADVAEYLKENLHRKIESNLAKISATNFDQEKLLDAVIQSFYEVNQEILRDKDLRMQGSTAVCSIVYEDKIYTFNTGDSFAFLLRNSSIIPLTEIAKPQKKRFEKSIDRLGGKLTRDRIQGQNSTIDNSRAFGDILILGVSERPKVSVLEVEKGDVYMLGSDGMNAEIPINIIGEHVLHFLGKGTFASSSSDVLEKLSLNEAVLKITEKCFNSGSKDNLTGLIREINT